MNPSIITSIKFRAKRRGMSVETTCNVEIDGETWATLDAEVAMAERLKIGQKFSEDRRQAVLFADEVVRARRISIRRVALKPRPRLELARMLKRKGFGDTAIDEALSRLEVDGYLDDGVVAARHLRKRLREGGYGLRRVRVELARMGIGETAIEVQIGELWPSDEEPGRCLELARSRAARYGPLDDEKNRRRLRGFLSRRGFSGEGIRRSIVTLASEADDRPDVETDRRTYGESGEESGQESF